MKQRTLLLIAGFAILSGQVATAQQESPDGNLGMNALYVPVTKDTAPKFRAGVKLGGSYNTVDGDLSFKGDYTPGGMAGGIAGLRKNNLGVVVEGLVSFVRYNKQDSFLAGGHISTVYLDVPILLEYKLAKGLWVQGGLQYSTLLAGSMSPTDSFDTDPTTFFQSQGFSAVLGVEYSFCKKWFAGARFLYGLSDVHNQSATADYQRWSTQSAQAYIGYNIHEK